MAAIGTSPQAGATPTITWTGTSSQLWSNSANWTPSGTPNSSSNVLITSPATFSSPSIDDYNVTIANLTVNANSGLDVNQGVDLVIAGGGYINDNGQITINQTAANSGTGLGISGAVTLEGSGNLILNAIPSGSLGTATIYDAGYSNLTQGAGHTISGTGQINVKTFTNNGTVNANSNGNTLLIQSNSQPYTNNNLLEATNSGTLQETSTTVNNGANGTIEANGGTVLLNGGTISGGTLTSISGSEIDEQSSTNLVGVTLSTGTNLYVLAGNDLIANNGSSNDVITNNGTITVNKGGSNNYTGIGITNSVELTGTGSIVLNANGTALPDAAIYDNGYSNLTQDSGHSITGTGQITVNAFTNNGTVNANSSGNTLAITNTNTNNGTYEASNGGTLNVANITNLSLGTLTGGTYEVAANSTMILPGSVTTNAATIVLNGANTTFAAISAVTSNTGTFKLENGATFTTAGNFTNSGTLSLDPSTLNVAGNLVLNNTSTFDMGIAGTHTGQFDTINVNGGSATVGGTLSLSLENGFTASIGESFVFLDATGGITGTFTNAGPYDVNGYVFELVKTSPNDLALQVGAVPEPTTLGLLTIGGLGLLARGKISLRKRWRMAI